MYSIHRLAQETAMTIYKLPTTFSTPFVLLVGDAVGASSEVCSGLSCFSNGGTLKYDSMLLC